MIAPSFFFDARPASASLSDAPAFLCLDFQFANSLRDGDPAQPCDLRDLRDPAPAKP
jgi:hypothetical protein